MPASQRKGLARARLAEHLVVCPLHPAVRRSRASDAVRQLREGVEVSPLLLGKYDPEDYRDRIHDYLKSERDKALATLFELDSRHGTNATVNVVMSRPRPRRFPSDIHSLQGWISEASMNDPSG